LHLAVTDAPQPRPLRLRSRVPPWADGMPLHDYLCRRFPYHDRTVWRAQIGAGRVRHLRAGQPAGPPLRRGDEVVYDKLHREPAVPTAVALLHCDERVVVADKPAHLPSHADGVFVRNTFVHVLRRLLGDDRVRLVHRLDRETSGVMVAARDADSARDLESQFRSGRVQKTYLAVVHGRVEADAFAIDPGAQPACTDCEVLARPRDCTLLCVRPRTGRTHQIRVHLHHAGHPLVGDKLYGRSDAEYLEWVHRVKAGGDPLDPRDRPTSRHLLHAAELAFRHPGSGGEERWSAPVPDDMAAFLAAAGMD
jgi:23S rRNA pseudouridine1911/1915/1917 synthase